MPAIPLTHAANVDTRSLESREALDSNQEMEIENVEERSIDSTDLLAAQSLLERSTIPDAKTLEARQNYILPIPYTYQGLNSGPNPGAVVGIVLGSVGGFLLLIYLLWAISNNGGSLLRTSGDIEEIDVRHHGGSRRSKRARSTRSEMSRAEPRRVIRTERIIRDVPIARSRSSSPRSRSRGGRDTSRIRETTIVEEATRERRVDGDDIVEVFEEHSELDPPRRKSRRSSGGYQRSVTIERERVYESGGDDDERRPVSGYRTVDPRQIGGGSFKPHRMR